MMFRRRQPQSLKHRLRNYVWPRSGLRRAWTYLMHRMLRIDDTSYGIAAGLASGVAISFTPYVGFHFVLAALLAWLIRGNIIASALGTLVGNPWTFPLIYVFTYELGKWILSAEHAATLPDDVTLKFLFAHPFKLLLPMTVGGIPAAILAWFVAFFPLKALVSRAQELRRHRRAAARNNGRNSKRRAEAKAP